MKFAETLKTLRKEKGFTQAQLAKEIGYSRAIIGFWEKGEKSPTLEALTAIADYFEVSIDYLAGREDESGRKIYINNSFNGVNNNIRL